MSNKRINFLKQIIDELKHNDTFFYVDTYENLKLENLENFIWIGTKNGIGITDCHYEIIFHEKDGGYDDIPSVEVHFEDKNFRIFKDINLPDCLTYKSWSCNSSDAKYKRDRRIVYSDIYTENNKKLPKPYDILILLEKIHKAIGSELEKRINKVIQQQEDNFKEAFNNYGKVIFGKKLPEYRYLPERHYPEKIVLIEHTEIQSRLIDFLQKKYKKNCKIIGLPGIYVEALLSDSKYADLITNNKQGISIYEVKTSYDPMQCIREALGQLFEYRWRLNEFGHKVNKLVIVGQIEESDEARTYLKEMNNMLSSTESDNKIILEYLMV